MQNITLNFRCLVLVVSLLIFKITLAQQHIECGTEVTSETSQYFENIKDRVFELEQEFLSLTAEERSSSLPNSVPIKAHIIRRSDGTGGLTEGQLNDAMTIMNDYYANAGLEFFLCDGINYIDDDNLFDFETSEESSMTSAHGINDIINIYFVNSVTSSTSGNSLCGYASFPGGPERILMANGCTTNGSTLSHEMGHFFALYHTHGTSNDTLTDELVNGTNCDTAGDRICDTPADPKLGSSTVNSSCIYTGFQVDANSDIFNPNPRNIMSYSRKSCRTEFSAQQYARMNAVYQVSRTNLTCSSFNADFVADVTESCGSNLTVNFTANTTGATSWSWDVDGDDIEDYNTQNPTHTYTNTGLYDVALTVSNGTNTINKVLYEYIEVGAQQISTSQITMSLTLDDWPSEITWEFTDGNGNALYTGGPYVEGTDDFATITETFNIDPNQCYSFSINDSYGDGICCASGDGSYQLLADDATVLVSSNGDFGRGEKNNFFSAVLSTPGFDAEGLRLYPNPSSATITIKNGNIQLPDSFKILNTIGQVIAHKKILSDKDLNINIEDFENGVYFIKLIKENTSRVLSFIKN